MENSKVGADKATDERALFEKWSRGTQTAKYGRWIHQKNQDGSYKSAPIEMAFLAWCDGYRAAIAGAPADTSQQGQPVAGADPLNTPLPCDITIGNCTIRKGVKLRALVTRAESLQRMLMKYLPSPSPEKVAEFEALFAAHPAPVAVQPAGELPTEEILKIVAANTGKRISLSLGDLDCYIAVARAALAARQAPDDKEKAQ